MKLTKCFTFLSILISAHAVTYRNAKYVEFEVKNEEQFDAVKALEMNSNVRYKN